MRRSKTPEEVGAMNDDGGAGRGRGGAARQNTHPEVGARNNGGTVGRRRDAAEVLRAWADHGHTHPTEIQNTAANYPGKLIFISRVVNGHVPNWHLFTGNLLPHSNITSCNGPHGYAIVDLRDSERLYACIRPTLFYQESRDMEHNRGVPVFLAIVVIADGPRLEADLAPSAERSTLNSDRLLFHGEHETRMLGLQSVGHVRYIKCDPNHPIDVDGDLYRFPRPDRRP